MAMDWPLAADARRRQAQVGMAHDVLRPRRALAPRRESVAGANGHPFSSRPLGSETLADRGKRYRCAMPTDRVRWQALVVGNLLSDDGRRGHRVSPRTLRTNKRMETGAVLQCRAHEYCSSPEYPICHPRVAGNRSVSGAYPSSLNSMRSFSSL